METRDFGIYVHMPFCPYICPYCDFAKEPWRASRESRYLTALDREIALAPDVRATTMFIGGGTPNMTDAGKLSALIAQLRARFHVPADAEITVEANPDPNRRFGFADYVAAGVTRLSIGVQSFVPSELEQLGRKHTAADVRAMVGAARAAGIKAISIDLMFAIPGQTAASLAFSVSAAIALGVEHISTYGLTIEDGTPYAARFADAPGDFLSDDAAADLYASLIAQLEAAGFDQYEISNFAQPGHRSRHNGNYWNNGEYLGFGVGAASYYRGRRWMKTKSLDEYCGALETMAPVPLASDESLRGAIVVGEAAMLALRRAQGITLADFNARYAVDAATYYAREIAEFSQLGLLEASAQHVRLTPLGRPLANSICAAFLRFDEAA